MCICAHCMWPVRMFCSGKTFNSRCILSGELPRFLRRNTGATKHRIGYIGVYNYILGSRPHPGWVRLNCLTNTDPNLLPFTTLYWVMSSNSIIWTPMCPIRCGVSSHRRNTIQSQHKNITAWERHFIRTVLGTRLFETSMVWIVYGTKNLATTVFI